MACRCQKVPLLTKKQRSARQTWAAEHRHWEAIQWARVIFSDESRFKLFAADGPRYVWGRKGKALDPCYMQKAVKHGGGSVMVWGCITRKGVGRIYRINGIMNAQKYTKILNEALLGTLSNHKLRPQQVIFQQDNYPKHTSKLARKWLKSRHLPVLPWPLNSPDMNIIDHVWSYLDHKVHSRSVLPRTTDELWKALEEEWYSIDDIVLANLYASCTRRVEALNEAKGGNTRY